MAAHVDDVATYILQRQGRMSAMKLHKLLYYCQAWHLVWEEEPLFDSEIEAWRDGPVVPDVFKKHKGAFMIDELPGPGDPADIDDYQLESIDVVLNTYGRMSAYELSERTHAEAPWINARRGVSPHDRSEQVISPFAMREYYAARLNER